MSFTLGRTLLVAPLRGDRPLPYRPLAEASGVSLEVASPVRCAFYIKVRATLVSLRDRIILYVVSPRRSAPNFLDKIVLPCRVQHCTQKGIWGN